MNDIHRQIGNAVPVQVAKRIARCIQDLAEAQTTGKPMSLRHLGHPQLEFNF